MNTNSKHIRQIVTIKYNIYITKS